AGTIIASDSEDHSDYIVIIDYKPAVPNAGRRETSTGSARSETAEPALAGQPTLQPSIRASVDKETLSTTIIPSKTAILPTLVTAETPSRDVGAASSSSGNPTSKKTRSRNDDESDAYSSADEAMSAKRAAAARGPRKTKMGVSQRRRALEEDEHTKAVEETQVRCERCNRWVALRKDRSYDIANWLKHKKTCSQITGKITKRVGVVKKEKPRMNVRTFVL
ncbi:hypothetical protein PLICRDRAFT_674213, partial [Plicaturopsis crispa FD-325 SS-3]